MFIKINNYCMRLENIEEFYPCNIIGDYRDNKEFTFIRHKDGSKGVYFINYYELLEIVNKALRLKNE